MEHPPQSATHPRQIRRFLAQHNNKWTCCARNQVYTRRRTRRKDAEILLWVSPTHVCLSHGSHIQGMLVKDHFLVFRVICFWCRTCGPAGLRGEGPVAVHNLTVVEVPVKNLSLSRVSRVSSSSARSTPAFPSTLPYAYDALAQTLQASALM